MKIINALIIQAYANRSKKHMKPPKYCWFVWNCVFQMLIAFWQLMHYWMEAAVGSDFVTTSQISSLCLFWQIIWLRFFKAPSISLSERVHTPSRYSTVGEDIFILNLSNDYKVCMLSGQLFFFKTAIFNI